MAQDIQRWLDEHPLTVRPRSAAGQAFAQAPAAPAAAEPDAGAAVEEIVVTGTAIRGVAPVGSATVNLNRDTIVQSGARDQA